ncbi:divalent-cation tolerance protein CutA [Athalia rosae]|uniref:divalent-cation tolerance protein CutA n=1 Tax=Athalia rosae TaxID=37344 RepID=UPI002033745D|nr:divalent-cation tolerance protein CutA [Athalia rosae]
MILRLVHHTGILGSRAMSYIPGSLSVAMVTVPTEIVAKKIACDVVKKKLAACVNILPKISSIYEWEGEVKEDQELLLIIKTKTDAIDALTKFVKDNHPYQVCEVISLPIQNGNREYLDWVTTNVSTG